MGFPRFRVDTKQSRSVLRSYSKLNWIGAATCS